MRKQFPTIGLEDVLKKNSPDFVDSVSVAGYWVQLGNPKWFGVIKDAIEHHQGTARFNAVTKLWYFWPFQGETQPDGEVIDLFPLMRLALHDSTDEMWGAVSSQYEYAPRHPILKRHLEEIVEEGGDGFRQHRCLEILVYCYGRKEPGFTKPFNSSWSRKKRTYLE